MIGHPTTVWMLRCQGLGLVSEAVFADPTSDEARAYREAMARRDERQHGVDPRTGRRRQLSTQWVAVPLVGDPALLVPYEAPAQAVPAPAGLPDLAIRGEGMVR